MRDQVVRGAVQLTEDVEWLDECFPLDVKHLHISVYLVRTDRGYIAIDSGAFYHRDSIRSRLKETTALHGLQALILSHADYPHAANVNAFRADWGDIDIVASSGVPELQGLPYARRSRLGESLEVLGRQFSFIDPPLADRSHTSWIYDHDSGVLFTADGMGHYHLPEHCSLTSETIPGGIAFDNIHDFHRDALVWLRYVDPVKMRTKLEAMFNKFEISYVAPIHGNPIARGDLNEYLDQLIASVRRISDDYAAPSPTE